QTFGGLDLALNAAGVMDGGDPGQPLNFQGQRNLSLFCHFPGILNKGINRKEPEREEGQWM
ncbi:MAG: hypothetical protein HC899_38545, partial [Leptolyngbyaceae cyanobacterium SM1_4_3]|nr:hypothetical protein [Leptolyngbyaceae cyanobacterium SM1_4_3]